MKKKSLFFKLLISFLGLGIVCGFVGGLGYYGVSVLHKTADITLEQTEGGKLLTEKEIDHLNWRTKVGTFQRNESMTKIEVETDYHKCGFGKWFYGEDRKSLEKLIPELRVLFEKIE
ncbi:MAG TPA: hypothetical protein DHW82_01705, partial [Spirochaetia bacterium]|nr:hypothetical protein [Spirochaetia bacterium]